jgi:phage anti-repressor protein
MSNNPLIPVFSGQINQESVQLVDARTLHSFLEVGKVFATWITDRIKQYDFLENQDFIAISHNREIGHGRGKTEYHLTLDMAKELSMVERNEKGKQARRYFIECEKRLLSELPEFLKPITAPISLEDFNWRHQVISNAYQNLQNAKVVIILNGSELMVGKRLAKSKRLF